MTASLLVRQVRLVPVGRGVPVVPDAPVDLRVEAGLVTEVGPAVAATGVDDVLDAGGRWAIPGLWDHHVHLTTWSRTRATLDLAGTTGPEEVVARVREHVAGLAEPAPGLVTGFGYRSGAWSRVGTVAELDAVTGDVPVVLTSGDAHNGWLNSAALRLLGVEDVTGPLAENDWFRLQPAITAQLERGGADTTALRAAIDDAVARGIVGVVDLEMPTSYRQWPSRVADGLDRLRIRASVYPEGLDDLLAAGVRTGDRLGSELVTMGPFKVISDGSLNTRTARCCEPYSDSGTRGTQNYDLDEMTTLLARATAGGLEIALHAIGDEAVDLALQAFAATGASGAVEHAQLVRLADLPRMARLGVRASVQPAHLLDDRDTTHRLWADRADRCFAFRSMVDAGVELALGSDAPVAPLDPWLAMAAAVHRSADGREPWNPAESLTPMQALAASTDGQPTIDVGSRGDVVLLDADPLVPQPSSGAAARILRGMPVAATIVAGRVVHTRI
ncbi:MAG TPA: amidohydrolase family protein [Lapillicoccus sp.]|nr:amidohydrolase family protein [Lapillicoccus sp.]